MYLSARTCVCVCVCVCVCGGVGGGGGSGGGGGEQSSNVWIYVDGREGNRVVQQGEVGGED